MTKIGSALFRMYVESVYVFICLFIEYSPDNSFLQSFFSIFSSLCFLISAAFSFLSVFLDFWPGRLPLGFPVATQFFPLLLASAPLVGAILCLFDVDGVTTLTTKMELCRHSLLCWITQMMLCRNTRHQTLQRPVLCLISQGHLCNKTIKFQVIFVNI